MEEVISHLESIEVILLWILGALFCRALAYFIYMVVESYANRKDKK